MDILCENSSIREYIKNTLNKIENDLDLELQDRLMRNGPINIYTYIYTLFIYLEVVYTGLFLCDDLRS